MSKAKALTRIHKRAEVSDSYVPRGGTRSGKRYARENSPRLVHGPAGMKSDNVRGRYTKPDAREIRDIRTDNALRGRAMDPRRNKLTATVAALKKA